MNKGMLDAEDDDLVAQSKRKSVNHHLEANLLASRWQKAKKWTQKKTQWCVTPAQ